jgi:hypothetical protein
LIGRKPEQCYVSPSKRSVAASGLSQKMPDHRSMAEAVAHELQSLEGERQRLEQLLDHDPNWRALRDLEAEADSSASLSADNERTARRATLLAALASNRIYAARLRLLEAIDLLAGEIRTSPPSDDEIVTIDQPDGSRVKVRVKARHRPSTGDTPRPKTAPPVEMDGAEGLFGNDSRAISVTVPGNAAPATGVDTLMSRLRRMSQTPPLREPAPRPPPGETGSAARSAQPARSPREEASDQAAHATNSAGYNGEIEEATVLIIQRDPALSKPVERSAARPPKAPSPGRRRGGSSKRKGGGAGKKPTGRSKQT